VLREGVVVEGVVVFVCSPDSPVDDSPRGDAEAAAEVAFVCLTVPHEHESPQEHDGPTGKGHKTRGEKGAKHYAIGRPQAEKGGRKNIAAEKKEHRRTKEGTSPHQRRSIRC